MFIFLSSAQMAFTSVRRTACSVITAGHSCLLVMQSGALGVRDGVPKTLPLPLPLAPRSRWEPCREVIRTAQSGRCRKPRAPLSNTARVVACASSALVWQSRNAWRPLSCRVASRGGRGHSLRAAGSQWGPRSYSRRPAAGSPWVADEDVLPLISVLILHFRPGARASRRMA